MLSEKYIAGFLDADGSFSVQFVSNKTGYFPRLVVEFTQETRKDKVLHLIRERTGGSISIKGNMSRLHLSCKTAKKLLSVIRKYLVIKRHYAGVCLDFLADHSGPFQKSEMDECSEQLKSLRWHDPSPIPNYPSRKWLAGYMDGDGCFACSYRKDTGCCYLSVRITAKPEYRKGIDLIKKAFGGAFYTVRKKQGEYPMWVLNLQPSKAKQFLRYFAKHLVVKRDQAYFILSCANGGNFRDGNTIKSSLKQLKAQVQRLNDPGADISAMLNAVNFNRELKRARPIQYAQATVHQI